MDGRYTALLPAKALYVNTASRLGGAAAKLTGWGLENEVAPRDVHVLAESAVWGCDGPLQMRFPPLVARTNRAAVGQTIKQYPGADATVLDGF